MYYSDEIIEEVRSRNDIVDVISEYVGLKKSGTSYKCCCPFHSEKTPSFIVSREKQIFHCFGCGAGGNVYTFIMKYENYSFMEAVEYLAKRAGITLPEKEMSSEDKKRYSRKQQMYEVNKSAAAYFHFLLTKTERGKLGYNYYKQRGFTDETIAAFGLGYADIYRDDLYKYLKSKGFTDTIMKDAGLVEFDERNGPKDKFWNRVMVPITDINGKIIAFGGRVLGDAKPKYLNTKETDIFNKSRNLFAMNIARHSRKRGVILCEGYMDVIAMHQAGFDNAIASLGTAFTEGQANLIKRYTTDVYLAYDSDGAGRNAAMKAIGILRNLEMSQKVIDLKPYKDPDEFIKNLGAEAYEERIRNALTGRIYEIDSVVDNFDLNSPDEKTAFMKEAAQLLAGIEDSAERQNYIESVSSKYYLNRDELKKLVTSAGLSGNQVVANEYQTREYRNRVEIDPVEEDQKYLITMMVNEPYLFEKLENVLSEEDFTVDYIRAVADMLFKQYRDTGTVNPAQILNRYEDAENQEKVSGIFTKELEFDTTPSVLEKALTDLIIKIKTANIDRLLKTGEGISSIELAKKKSEIKRLRIKV
ncbi:MAG TPA: DNA primase [Lachnospiraceae bacterium]|nr:DNA primase [Eubacterium sp.]HBZ03877.1 DNA primase [Lachnospiraceae bacterium]